ncbi:MAG: enoyl-CoA hydratase [Rhodospirillaceae bacterium]|jgi:enoyl-CoA hydratase/carnithine racemase|nr:enoyl-CoA hydratase [Rhodospirillaceae bacterium]MBT5245654.1 enoyl-CoA hydratase [Rhodospirillaceae bacterium]MBT5561875.1 enoyl-CoA hydratase [Rhodospirillaceae bacterium]MBT6240481.1 enoyl-CoA hydratase [Rhodospirillaceae bacterium]MBT7136556.1 enoyl-CoA hydratase [Rhodospirillaceae bacterium]
MTAQPQQQADAALILRNDLGGVATLTLNRPDQRNALSVDLMSAIEAELATIATDETVRAVVIAANGPAFCAGHDMKEMRANPDEKYYLDLFEQCSRMMLAINRLPQPVIARIHALATAAGCQLVATCDLAVAGHSAWFATPGVHIGLFCSTPMVALSRNVGRKQAMEMLLTGDRVEAEQAERWGLINKAVDDDKLDQTIADITAKLVTKSPLTLAIGKEAFYAQIDMDVEAAYAYASQTMTRNMLARDAEEGIDAFLEKRQPTWQGR